MHELLGVDYGDRATFQDLTRRNQPELMPDAVDTRKRHRRIAW